MQVISESFRTLSVRNVYVLSCNVFACLPRFKKVKLFDEINKYIEYKKKVLFLKFICDHKIYKHYSSTT